MVRAILIAGIKVHKVRVTRKH